MSDASLPAAAARTAAAATVADLFGADDHHRQYRELAAIVHPDRYVLDGDRAVAVEAMAKLTRLWAERNGTPAAPAIVGNWVVLGPLAKGALNDLYRVQHVTASTPGVLKIARHPRDNDLLKREADTLKRLWKAQGNFHKYLPGLLDTFEASYRRANVVTLAGDCHSLEHIKRQFPRGIDFRHVVWMMNRLLSALGYLRTANIIHGAVLPQHLLYRPSDHGLVLIDFTASISRSGDLVPYIVKRFETHYPLEALLATPSKPRGWAVHTSDISMAFAAMRYAAADVPRSFRDFFALNMLESWQGRRFDDAWDVQDRWVQLAENEYGPPKWVPFEVPVN